MTLDLNDGGRFVLVDFDMRTIRSMPPCSDYQTIVHQVGPALSQNGSRSGILRA